MPTEELPNALGDALREDSNRDIPHGEYHPSTISGCSLKAVLKKMTDSTVPLNRWIFNGTAVHYYLQESGILTDAMKDAGFHPIEVSYEVPKRYELKDGVWISGRCDILAHDETEGRVVLDIKYSSIPTHSNHGRLYKYAGQANAYASMFNADKFGLLVINSKSDDIPSDIDIIAHEQDDETWEIMLDKALNMHSALEEQGYDGSHQWAISDLKSRRDETIEMLKEVVREHLDRDNIPAYEKECQYCDHKEYCPVEQGEMGGLKSL